MILPNLSYMMTVGQTRYIQARYEAAEYRNPDVAVADFLSPRQRLEGFIRGKFFLSRLRENPFYHYVLARTMYYDKVFLDAIHSPVKHIVNIGCGSDTRAYRYAHILNQNGVRITECDQAEAIRSKQQIASRRWPTGHVDYQPLDLNSPDVDGFLEVLNARCKGPTLVMLEGVSPYIDADAFGGFLRRLAAQLEPGSELAYDFKINGVAAGFGQTAAVRQPFRLPTDADIVAAFHRKLGFHVRHIELSSALVARLLPKGCPAFAEDCLLRLTPDSGLA